jgi:hypothetical protein
MQPLRRCLPNSIAEWSTEHQNEHPAKADRSSHAAVTAGSEDRGWLTEAG